MNKLRLTGLLLTRLLGLWLVCASCVQSGYAQQSGGGNYPTGNGVRVREVDGSPNVPGTQTLVFPNGSLTRAGQTVTVTIAGGTTINSTNGQLPYRVNSTTFGDSAFASNALNSTYLSATSGASGSGLTLAVAGGGTNEDLKLSSKAAASITLNTNSTNRWNVNSSGHFLANTDNTYDIGASGATRPKNIYVANFVNATNYVLASNGFYLGTGGSHGALIGSSDGVWRMINSATTSFNRLQFGGTSASFPAIKRSSAELQVVLADDTGFAATQSLYIRYGSGTPEGAVTAPVGAIYSRTDGGAGTSFYVKESGSGNTGWVAK